ncbi:MAG: hypothetical protein H6679_02850 [Epsilonproteobacteria bacterium]|nr:hypothetical protein [Campylobacterota bacterium]
MNKSRFSYLLAIALVLTTCSILNASELDAMKAKGATGAPPPPPPPPGGILPSKRIPSSVETDAGTTKPAGPSKFTPPMPTGKAGLLDEIRAGGFKLKPATERKVPEKSVKTEEPPSIQEALLKVFQKRKAAEETTKKDEGEDVVKEDEWDEPTTQTPVFKPTVTPKQVQPKVDTKPKARPLPARPAAAKPMAPASVTKKPDPTPAAPLDMSKITGRRKSIGDEADEVEDDDWDDATDAAKAKEAATAKAEEPKTEDQAIKFGDEDEEITVIKEEDFEAITEAPRLEDEPDRIPEKKEKTTDDDDDDDMPELELISEGKARDLLKQAQQQEIAKLKRQIKEKETTLQKVTEPEKTADEPEAIQLLRAVKKTVPEKKATKESLKADIKDLKKSIEAIEMGAIRVKSEHSDGTKKTPEERRKETDAILNKRKEQVAPMKQALESKQRELEIKELDPNTVSNFTSLGFQQLKAAQNSDDPQAVQKTFDLLLDKASELAADKEDGVGYINSILEAALYRPQFKTTDEYKEDLRVRATDTAINTLKAKTESAKEQDIKQLATTIAHARNIGKENESFSVIMGRLEPTQLRVLANQLKQPGQQDDVLVAKRVTPDQFEGGVQTLLKELIDMAEGDGKGRDKRIIQNLKEAHKQDVIGESGIAMSTNQVLRNVFENTFYADKLGLDDDQKITILKNGISNGLEVLKAATTENQKVSTLQNVLVDTIGYAGKLKDPQVARETQGQIVKTLIEYTKDVDGNPDPKVIDVLHQKVKDLKLDEDAQREIYAENPELMTKVAEENEALTNAAQDAIAGNGTLSPHATRMINQTEGIDEVYAAGTVYNTIVVNPSYADAMIRINEEAGGDFEVDALEDMFVNNLMPQPTQQLPTAAIKEVNNLVEKAASDTKPSFKSKLKALFSRPKKEKEPKPKKEKATSKKRKLSFPSLTGKKKAKVDAGESDLEKL